jgi:ferredoxin
MTEAGKNKTQGTDTIEPVFEELASKLEDADEYYGPRILRVLLSVEEAGVVLELPATAEEIAEKRGLDQDRVSAILMGCVKKGVCTKTPKGEIKRVETFIAIQDLGSANPALADVFTEEYFELFSALRRDKDYLARVALIHEGLRSMNGGNAPVRVVPRWKAIKNVPGVMPCEDIREILKAYEGRLSTSRCGCRLVMNTRSCTVNDGTHPDEGLCVHFDTTAEYLTNELGMGGLLSSQQVLENLDGLDKSPIYHTVDNHRDPRFICNCCSCCCDINMPATRTEGVDHKEQISPSRFLSTVSAKSCDGCGICLTKCPFDAITLEDGNRAVIDPDKCMGSGACAVNCPRGALTMKIVRPPEHIPEMGLFYVNSAFDEADPE